MAPLRRQPGVVEIEPADHAADVEGRLDRIELDSRARHARAARHHRARHERAQMLRAGRILQGQHRAAERVHQHERAVS